MRREYNLEARIRTQERTIGIFNVFSLFIAVLGLSLILDGALAAVAIGFESEKEKLGYSVGYQVGADFRRQGLSVNPEIVTRGLLDAMAGSEPLLTAKEMRRILVEVQRDAVAARQKQREELALQNRTEGEAFLAKNGAKEGVVTLSSGLQYRILTAGSGRTPQASDTITVHYRGSLIDGSEFDSSYGRGEPATFKANRVIAGWKEALQLMKEGARWQLFVPPELGYGESGNGRIGPNSTLIFEVELLSVTHSASGS